MLKGNKANKIFLISAVLSLIITIFLLFKQNDEIEWTSVIWLVFVPTVFMLPLMMIFYSSKIHGKFISKSKTFNTSTKAILVSLSIILMLFQLVAFTGWIMSIVEGRIQPLLIHFISYYYTVGLIYNISVLYKLTASHSIKHTS